MKNEDKVKLITVGTYGGSVLANIMKTKLEAAGIDSVLMSENLVNIINISQVSGAIKLQVREEDVEAAKEILEITSDESPVEEPTTDEGVTCPRCGSKDTVVALGRSNAFAAVWMLLLCSFPFYSKKRYYCNTCKKYFKARPASYS